MKNIVLEKEEIGKEGLVLINPNHKLKNYVNDVVPFNDKYQNIKLKRIANSRWIHFDNKGESE